MSAAERQAMAQRLIYYLEPLRAPPPERAPANRLPCNVSSWQCIHADPPVYTCDNFLSSSECEQLIGLGGRHGLMRSQTAGDTTSGTKAAGSVIRSSSTATLDHVWPECAPLTEKIEALTGRDWTHFEPIALTRYIGGEQYTAHHDGLTVKRQGVSLDAMQFFAQGGQRAATVLVYLSDVEEGGETAFTTLGVEVRPKAGRCLLFFPGHLDGRLDEQMEHAAKPVVRGVKWVTQVWVRAHSDPIRSLTPPRWPRGVKTMTDLVKDVLMGSK